MPTPCTANRVTLHAPSGCFFTSATMDWRPPGLSLMGLRVSANTFVVLLESPQSDNITVAGAFGGSTEVTCGLFVGRPWVTTWLKWSVYRLRLIVVSALSVANLFNSGAFQSDVSPALAIASHMPRYAALACSPASSASGGDDGRGTGGAGTAVFELCAGSGALLPPQLATSDVRRAETEKTIAERGNWLRRVARALFAWPVRKVAVAPSRPVDQS